MRILFLRAGRSPAFPEAGALTPDESGLVALGGELTPELVVEAYSKGVFPWDGTSPVPWFSPDPRMVLAPGEFHASRSLTRLARKARFEITIDKAFRDVIWRCANTRRNKQHGTWINGDIMPVYLALHAQGIAHSVEVWDQQLGGQFLEFEAPAPAAGRALRCPDCSLPAALEPHVSALFNSQTLPPVPPPPRPHPSWW